MSIVPLRPSLRARVRELLPWHVNGTLSPTDEAMVRAQVAGDLATRRECNETRTLAAFIASGELLEPDLERQLRRVRAQLHAPLRSSAPRMRWRAAALLLLPLAGLSAFTMHQLTAPRFATHSDAVAPSGPALLRLRMQVDPAITGTEIDALLRPFGAQVAVGPRSPGLHTIEVPPAQRGAVERMLTERFAPSYLAPAAY